MTETAQHVTGGCFCGAVRYEAQAYLHSAYYCHCRTCQHMGGEPFEIGIPLVAGSLNFTRGEPRYFQTSDHAKRGFCEICGARISYQPLLPEYQHFTQVLPGSLDRPEDVRPKFHIYIDSQWPWFETADDLPRLRRGEMPDDPVSWSPGQAG